MNHMPFRGFKLFYENRATAESMVRQIDDFPSFFTPSHDRPLIIDCGANIGVSVLEWKTRWPGSQVICFEPDPFAFAVLHQNIERNDVPGVRCIQAAIADFDGRTELFGEIRIGGDARGNSIDPAWGQRDRSDVVEVPCRRLAPFLTKDRVDFLKMDIEGAEQSVLIDSAGELESVEAIYVEVHQTDRSRDRNSSQAIAKLLVDAGFSIENEPRYAHHALPPHLDPWQKQAGASQTHILGWR